MGKIEISKKFIEENFELCNFSGSEALFYKNNDKIYKLYKYKSLKLPQLELLEKNKISNAINIEDILVDGNKVIGATTIYDSSWINLKKILMYRKFNVHEKKEIFIGMLKFTNDMLNKGLFYRDFHFDNVGLANNELKFLDLDGCIFSDKSDERLINLSYINMYRMIISMILNINEVLNTTYVKEFQLENLNKDNITKFIINYNKSVDNEINMKHYLYQSKKNKNYKN